MPKIDNEKLLFIRGMIAMAHVDGKYSIEEEQLINARVDAAALPQHQRDVLDHDRMAPMAPLDVYKQIPSIKGKGIFLSIARNLVHIDGEFCAAERAAMDEMEGIHQIMLDQVVPKIRADLEVARSKTNMEIMDARLAGKGTKGGPFGALIRWVFDR